MKPSLSWLVDLVLLSTDLDRLDFVNNKATLFGQLWRLEPLPKEKKDMWRREMEWLLCVSDHIVEMTPTWQTFPDGTKLEVLSLLRILDLLGFLDLANILSFLDAIVCR